MYIVYVSSRFGSNQCRYAITAEEVNTILDYFDMPEITGNLEEMIDEFFSIDCGNPIILFDKYANKIGIHKLHTRDVFMSIFRAEHDDQGLSTDDRHEVFGGIMLGASDFTADGIQSIFNDYDVRQCAVIDYNLEPDDFQVQMELISENYVQMYDNLKSEREQQ